MMELHLYRHVLIVTVCFIVLCSGAPNCQNQISPCACETDQGLIDLSPLDLAITTGEPKFPSVSGSGDTFSYNPCTAYTEHDSSSCTNVAACQFKDGNTYDAHTIGTQESATFSTEEHLMITYAYAAGQTWTSKVALICDDSEGELSSTGEDGTSAVYDFTLTSKYACPGGGGGLSVGSILLIVFFSLVAVYLIAGVVYNRFAKGASGWELLPNLDFWKALPGMIKDGCLFLWNKITGNSKHTGYGDI